MIVLNYNFATCDDYQACKAQNVIFAPKFSNLLRNVLNQGDTPPRTTGVDLGEPEYVREDSHLSPLSLTTPMTVAFSK